MELKHCFTTVSLLISLSQIIESYKLLVVFPFPGKSHGILGEGYVRHLLEAGHEVTYISPLPPKPQKNLRHIDVSENFQIVPTAFFSLTVVLEQIIDTEDTELVFSLMGAVTNATINNKNVQKLMRDPNEQFDAVIVEYMYSGTTSGLSAAFGCPLIWSSSLEPHSYVISLIDELPNPAYTIDSISKHVWPLNFWQRLKELRTQFEFSYRMWHTYEDLEAKIYEAAVKDAVAIRGRTLPPYDQVKYNGSLILSNSHPTAGEAMKLPQALKPILGYHIKDKVEPLPENLKKIMDNAKHGVIYFSMGSMLPSKTWPEQIKKEILEIFANRKETILWKFEEKLENIPKNVHLLDWAPQPSILAHPNCKLFITHGGLLSLTETIHHGVPVIGIPVFADQFANVARVQRKGYGLSVQLSYGMASDLKVAIEEILSNPSYKITVKELQLAYHDRLVPPGKELVYWVEHVVKTRGALYLRSPALTMTWYSKMYLDLLALVLAVITVALLAIRYVVGKLFCNKKVSLEKKKN